MRIAGAIAFLLSGLAAAHGQSCPEPLASARRLVLVTAPDMNTPNATIERFERAGDRWQLVAAAQPALIGRNGMAWSQAFRALAGRGEPIKVDGDKRAPAGFYRIGGSFGFAPSSRANYLHVKEGTVCVDEPASPAYNTITTRAKVGSTVHAENMWRVPAYRHGLLVDYPTDRKNRAGSCIFIHIRMPDAKYTQGCVAVPEAQVLELQDFADGGAVIAILPEHARSRIICLPQR
jgi:L,D-peptidoglycan transpeptidase YkuD (ErfK/YbiS/YcfS/YnhG family)